MTEIIIYPLTTRMKTRKRKAKSTSMSLWREQKSAAHRTVNGKGIVGRL